MFLPSCLDTTTLPRGSVAPHVVWCPCYVFDNSTLHKVCACCSCSRQAEHNYATPRRSLLDTFLINVVREYRAAGGFRDSDRNEQHLSCKLGPTQPIAGSSLHQLAHSGAPAYIFTQNLHVAIRQTPLSAVGSGALFLDLIEAHRSSPRSCPIR